MSAASDDLGPPPEDVGELTKAQRTEQLADELAGLYECLHVNELETSDPERAKEHREAAAGLVAWLDEGPRRERKAAFSRGWERAKQRRNERAELRIAELEDLVASLRTQDDPGLSHTAVSWRRARQDPRYDLVRREALQLDSYDGTMVIPYPLQELLAVRVMTAILTAEASTGCGTVPTPDACTDDPAEVVR
ncbi:hypothetical protein ACWDG9_16350 [Streptomyces sp. NPDC001073]